MTPIEIYALLPVPAQQACTKVGAALFSKATGLVLSKFEAKDATAAIYRKWQESFQSQETGERKLNAAFEEFFSRPDVKAELKKLRHDRYAAVDFKVLERELGESFELAECPPPQANAVDEIGSWVRDLREMLKDEGIGTPRLDTRSAEAFEENDSLARKKYLAWVVREHRNIQFSGMAVVDERTEVELARVFVMPHLLAQRESGHAKKDDQKGVPAYKLLTAKKARQRLMILGGSGSGKTTLLEALALGFAQPAAFRWSRPLPELLPVFYRVRDLDKDLETHGTVWDCIQHHCSKRIGEELPLGFFTRQMQGGGVALLFDGLDEASSFARRNEIVDLVAAVAEQLPPGSRVIVTSRPHDYRHRFDSVSWAHFDLVEFDNDEIQTFIQGWQNIHEPDCATADARRKDLWQALESREDILPLARNALLLTMIVRVHFGLGALPDSRLGLYEKCAETLLKHWARAAGLPESPIDTAQKHKLLARLAYEMQSETEQWDPGLALQIANSDLRRRFEAYLQEGGCPNTFELVERVIERLHARDAILVQYGTDQRGQDLFGFVHRSFQEYFAASWMAQELDDAEFEKQLFERPDGWEETLYLAVAQLSDKPRRKTLLELLKKGNAGFAVECLKAAVPEQPWLRLLVQFLARHTRPGTEYRDLLVGQCADACEGRTETFAVLSAMFERENREGQSLAAAVELAGELARRGQTESRTLLEGFFAEATNLREDMVEIAAGEFPYKEGNEMVDLPAFKIDRYPVTNDEYERMIPGRRGLRGNYSDTDGQPVINVSWYESRLYARWRGGRLPTEQEWEKAASWDSQCRTKRIYPWGDDFDTSRCNTSESAIGKTTSVGTYPTGVSSYGVHDMAGNVFEWTNSLWLEGNDQRVVRGGSWYNDRALAACASRGIFSPYSRINYFGFRCART